MEQASALWTYIIGVAWNSHRSGVPYAAYEGFFGRLKNELFHSKNWEDVTFDGLSRLPDERIEKSLGHMSPNNTVGAYAQRFRRVRGNRPRPLAYG